MHDCPVHGCDIMTVVVPYAVGVCVVTKSHPAHTTQHSAREPLQCCCLEHRQFLHFLQTFHKLPITREAPHDIVVIQGKHCAPF
jgi:hypothetical protein